MLQITIAGIVIAIVVMIVREVKPSIAVLVSVMGSVCLLLAALPYVEDVYSLVQNLSEKSGMNSDLLISLIKIAGIAMVTEFAADICSDAGEASLGDKIHFVGKMAVLASCVPVITTVFSVAESLAR